MRSLAAWPFWALLMLLFACDSETAKEIADPDQKVLDCCPGNYECLGPDEIRSRVECPDPDLHAVGFGIAGARALLEGEGYYVTKGIDVLDRPPGFPEEDEFPLVPRKQSEFSEKDGGAAMAACKEITKRELEAVGALDEWYKPVYRYCRHRIMNSSRAWQLGKQITSEVDGSPVHDRDRPSGKYFYDLALAEGVINPDVCPHHRLPPMKVEHPPECYELAKNYEERFKTPLDPARKARWLNNSHAYEAFTAYGPVDANVLYAYRTIGGCYPFSAYARTDVAATYVVRRSIRICAKYHCDNVSTIKYIKPHWNEAI